MLDQEVDDLILFISERIRRTFAVTIPLGKLICFKVVWPIFIKDKAFAVLLTKFPA